MASDAVAMIWERRMVGYPVGTHLSEVKPSLLAFKNGTNALSTHAIVGPPITWSPAAVFAAGAVAGLTAVGVAAVAVKTAPKVRARLTPRAAQRQLAEKPAELLARSPAIAAGQLIVDDAPAPISVTRSFT